VAAHYQDVRDARQLPPEADLHALRDGKRLGRGRFQMDQEAGGEGLMEA
jgi:hypothetical protein